MQGDTACVLHAGGWEREVVRRFVRFGVHGNVNAHGRFATGFVSAPVKGCYAPSYVSYIPCCVVSDVLLFSSVRACTSAHTDKQKKQKRNCSRSMLLNNPRCCSTLSAWLRLAGAE